MQQARGFTLVEVTVAMAILALVMLTFLGSRTDAMIDATEARDWRLAKELAEQMLSELRAGAREMPPVSGQEVAIEKYPGFTYRFLIGEQAISDYEAGLATEADANEQGTQNAERRNWQRQRDQMRLANQKGLSVDQYQENLLKDSGEEKLPSEDEIEEVEIIIAFPIVRASRAAESDYDKFTLRAKVCTMALQGLTPEKAEAYAKANGTQNQPGGGGSTSGGSGSSGGSGNSGTSKE